MAFALYMVLTPSECDDRGRDVQRVASILHRTPNAVSLKIWNIAANDRNRRMSGRVGMTHGSRLDHEVWEEYSQEGDIFFNRCLDLVTEVLRQADSNDVLPSSRFSSLETASRVLLGEERMVTAAQRVHQEYFRNSLLTNYHHSCCLSGIRMDSLLIASHIKPWAVSTPKEKTASSNGLLLNAFLDRAFDQGFITIDHDYRVIVSDEVGHSSANDMWLYRYAGQKITLPEVNPPSHEFIDYHNGYVFRRAA